VGHKDGGRSDKSKKKEKKRKKKGGSAFEWNRHSCSIDNQVGMRGVVNSSENFDLVINFPSPEIEQLFFISQRSYFYSISNIYTSS
jgi:hypothetical protein